MRLNFEDGSSATCDILVGFDGIKSVVRKLFLESEGLWKSPSFEPVWSGTYAYRGVVPFEELSEHLPGHTAIKFPMKVCFVVVISFGIFFTCYFSTSESSRLNIGFIPYVNIDAHTPLST